MRKTIQQVRELSVLGRHILIFITEIMGYNGAPIGKVNKLIDEDSTLSLRHTGFKGKAVDIADLPHWTWCEGKCQDWISEFATTYLRMNSWEGGEFGQRFAGNGRLLYCTTKADWITLLGTEKRGGLIYEFLVKASREKGVVPPGVVISHQNSRD